MDAIFTALLMLYGLGPASFAAAAAGRRGALAALFAGFGGAAIWISPRVLPDPGWIGSIAALAAAVELFRRRFRWLAPLCGGALAASGSALLQIQGLPPYAALPAAAALPAISAYLAVRRKEFAPAELREEAMLVTIALGLAVAIIPEMSAGWRSALALNREQGDSSNVIIADWVLVTTAVSLVLGGFHALLRRRWMY